jgi:hypothetical protein
MTTLHEKRAARHFKPSNDKAGEKRENRRFDLGGQTLMINRWDTAKRATQPLGYLMDLSASGVRVRTENGNIKADSQIRVRLELPSYAGICPFVETESGNPKPKTEWVGWLAVSRVKKVEGQGFDVAGRLVDMDEMDRGMLGLYLSTQPLAA